MTRLPATSLAVLGALVLGAGPAAALPGSVAATSPPAATQVPATTAKPTTAVSPAATSPAATAKPAVTGSPAARATTPPASSATCADGWAALQAGHLQQAKAIYGSVVPADSACARAGQSAAVDLLKARALISAGFSTSAPPYVEDAVQAEPTMTVPHDVLPQTIASQVAANLDHEGLRGPARQVLLQLIENDPSAQLSSEDLAILGQASPPLGTRILHVIFNPVFLLCLGLLALLALSLHARLRRRLHFESFDAGNDTDAGPGPTAALRSLIRRELHRLAEESARLRDGRRLRIDQAGPYEDQFDLGPVLGALPLMWKPLALAVDTLIKGMGTRSRLIGGMLLPASSLILELRAVDGTVQDMCTIKHHELGFPPGDQDVLPQLALPSAAWIALTHYPGATLGGTRDWRSYVDFAAGCAWQDKGDTGRARDCYIRACNHPDNLAAQINLAALEQREEYTAPQHGPAGLPSYQRLSALVKDTAGRTGDLQWYRTRYLLSAGLRDILDLSPNGTRHHLAAPAQDHDSPKPGASMNGHLPERDETLAGLARRRAVELALELEEKVADRGGLPRSFVQYGRAAALTLVARQVDLSTSDLEKVLVDGTGKPDYTDGGAVRRALLDVLHGAPDDGTAERLVEFVRSYCPVDDQAQYNLYRYHQTRARTLASAIENWNGALRRARQAYGERPPEWVWDWAEDVSHWQRALASLYDTEVSQMRECARQVKEGGDPALIERLDIVRRLDPDLGRAGGRHHERPAEDEFRLTSPAPRVTPDATGAVPAPSQGPARDAVPETAVDPGAPFDLSRLALPAEPPEPPPTRPDAEPFYSPPDRQSGRDGDDLVPPTRLDLPDDAPPVQPVVNLAEGEFRDPGTIDRRYSDDYPDEPGV